MMKRIPRLGSVVLRTTIEWREWIILVWVIGWGVAYCAMVVEARAPLVQTWLRGIGK